MAKGLALDLDHPENGYIVSSLGVAELGLNLGFETPATSRLRRLAAAHPALACDLFGRATGTVTAVPAILTFNPGRTFVEIASPDADGYGKMTVSRYPDRSIPLLRHQTSEVARLLDRDDVTATVRRHGLQSPDLPVALLALPRRSGEALPDRALAGIYTAALRANHEVARHLTGAVRLTFTGNRCTMHVQLAQGHAPEDALERAILRELAPEIRPAQLVLWPYAAFPCGIGLDHERRAMSGDPDAGRPAGLSGDQVTGSSFPFPSDRH
jgi:phenylacetate-CoA ligase